MICPRTGQDCSDDHSENCRRICEKDAEIEARRAVQQRQPTAKFPKNAAVAPRWGMR